jgi:hypothetical protein
MDFDNFALSRDLFYLAGALTGAAAGCFLTLFRKDRSIRSRNRRISVLLCVLSGTIAAIALSLIISQRGILRVNFLLVSTGIFVFVFMFAVVFPRAVAYPLILVGGLLFVWVAYTFLRFPEIEESSVPLAFVSHERESLVIRFPSGDRDQSINRNSKSRQDKIEQLVVSGDAASLEFFAMVISYNRLYPLIGGEKRGVISMIRRGDELLYTDPHINELLFSFYYSHFNSQTGNARFGIDYRNFQGKIPAAFEGINLRIFFNDQGLFFIPSSQ